MGPFTVSESPISRAYISPSLVGGVKTTEDPATINVTLE